MTSDLNLYDAIQSHADLSIPAMHLSLLPFLQPLTAIMRNAPCNLTAVIPASAAILELESFYIPKKCRGKWANTNACKTAQQLLQLDRVAVANAKVRKHSDAISSSMRQQPQQPHSALSACRRPAQAEAKAKHC